MTPRVRNSIMTPEPLKTLSRKPIAEGFCGSGPSTGIIRYCLSRLPRERAWIGRPKLEWARLKHRRSSEWAAITVACGDETIGWARAFNRRFPDRVITKLLAQW